jgi:hypothetical protein
MGRPPLREELPSDRKPQIESTDGQIERSPTNAATTASSIGGLNPDLMGLFNELWPDPALAAVHHGRQRGGGSCRQPTSPGGVGEQLFHGRTPKLGNTLHYHLYRGAGRPSHRHSGRRGHRRRGEGRRRVKSLMQEHGRRREACSGIDFV